MELRPEWREFLERCAKDGPERVRAQSWQFGDELRARGHEYDPDPLTDALLEVAGLAELSATWDTEAAFERAVTAFRYVEDVYLSGTGYEPLDAHTQAAWEAERARDWPAFEDALRNLMRAAKREAMRERAA
jgi:hypothetical protein